MFALDTNTVIHFFKGVGRVKDWLLAVPPAEIAIPAVVLFELEVGIGQSGQASKWRSQLDALAALVIVKLGPMFQSDGCAWLSGKICMGRNAPFGK